MFFRYVNTTVYVGILKLHSTIHFNCQKYKISPIYKYVFPKHKDVKHKCIHSIYTCYYTIKYDRKCMMERQPNRRKKIESIKN